MFSLSMLSTGLRSAAGSQKRMAMRYIGLRYCHFFIGMLSYLPAQPRGLFFRC